MRLSFANGFGALLLPLLLLLTAAVDGGLVGLPSTDGAVYSTPMPEDLAARVAQVEKSRAGLVRVIFDEGLVDGLVPAPTTGTGTNTTNVRSRRARFTARQNAEAALQRAASIINVRVGWEGEDRGRKWKERNANLRQDGLWSG